MAAPIQANVNTAGGGAISVANDIIEQTDIGSYTKSFKRTLQHYVTNSGTSATPTAIETATDARYNQGWYHVPYTRPRASLTTNDLNVNFFPANGYELLEQGFKITKMNVMQQAVVAAGAGNKVVNSFVSAPQIMIFKDTRHDIFEYVTLATAPDPNTPIWSLQNSSNSMDGIPLVCPFANAPIRFTEVSNGTSGTLIETGIWQRGWVGGGGESPDPYFMDLMNGGDIELMSTGGSFSYSYKPRKKFLFPPNITDIDNGFFSMMNDTTFVWKNAATEVILNNPDPPMLHLIKVPPLSDNLGNINIAIELWIEYHSTWKFFPGRYHYTRGQTSAAVSGSLPYFQNQRKFVVSSGDFDLRKRKKVSVPKRIIRLPNTKR